MTLIRYNKKALKDLDDIYLSIAKDKKSVADEFINQIDDYISLLNANPKMGKDCHKKGLTRDCRALIYGNYMILYKIYANHISIQRVINTKQNYKG